MFFIPQSESSDQRINNDELGQSTPGSGHLCREWHSANNERNVGECRQWGIVLCLMCIARRRCACAGLR
ncbi:hypothetical protein ACLBQX_27470, partial [Klebsiella pneumoniae]